MLGRIQDKQRLRRRMLGLRRDKQRLRRRMLGLRRAVPRETAAEAAEAVAASVLSAPELRGAVRIALYAALPDELPTRPLLEAARDRGLEVLLPRVLADDALEFASWGAGEALVKGRFGVREPAPERPSVLLDAADVLCLPGVAFDRAGHRLGRGGGFYDRFLASLPTNGPWRLGLAYDLQLLDAVPHGPDDERVDAIASESGLQRVGESRGRE